MPSQEMTFRPIGFVRSPYSEQSGTPIQPVFGEDTEATVEIAPEYVDGLRDLVGFERIWLVLWFDRARPAKLRVTPYMDTVERGVFATRAPSRPNSIGLSCVRLLRIEGATLHIAGVDALDSTPVLDIKPYVPRFDAYPNSRAGWLDSDEVRARRGMRADERFDQALDTEK